MQEEIVFRYLARHKIGAFVFVFVAIGSIFSVLYFLDRGQQNTEHLYEPKLLMLRVDEVPSPKGATNPVEVMAGTSVVISCENVIPPKAAGVASYRFHVGGKSIDSPVCARDFVIPGPINSTQKIALEYLFQDAGKKEKRVVDHWDATVHIVPAREFVRIRNFGRTDRTVITGHTIPREVIPYVEAALPLDGPSDKYTVLFFVEAMGTGVPILQATGRPNAQHRIEAIAAPVARYRGYGTKIGGYAAWPALPIQIGGLEDERALFEVYAGIFEKKNVQAVVDQLLTLDEIAQDGQAVVKVVQKPVEEIRRLAWKRWLSEPMRVVRAANTPEENAARQAAAASEL
jgi:hypothetical protein